jgi:hypothetical protein
MMKEKMPRLSAGCLFLLMLILSSLPAYAAPISIGQITLNGDSPAPGLQQIEVLNMTGSGCDPSYPVCNAISITDWMLSVTYSSGAVVHAENSTWLSSSDDIGPTTPSPSSFPWVLDFSCTANSCPPYDTVVMQVSFSGTLNNTILQLSDNSVFFAQPDFTVQFTPVPDFAYLDSADILVTDQSQVPVPEPSTLSYMLFALIALVIFPKLRLRSCCNH